MGMNVLGTSRFAPWAALVAALGGEALHHQLLADMLRFQCELGSLVIGLGVASVSWLLMASGSAISWFAVRGDDAHPHLQTRRFTAQLGWLACALCAVGVAWQTLATWLVPSCP
ncbi:hypothetical protein [Lysobacter auxotrophicus]|uniref:Uncharacterized protein n=1 Tax=Lysobacter auxotrophicus TaxID=2992573 RepID=A0ABM8DCW6_9GAMM|nr:hypothetical protein [Lysobacter auxotrophicus]BDU16421.1 hypothetical protein LA521A_16220 [Lysobacter auxotrophicus]